MYCYFTSCFVCEHSRLMITKPNSKIGSGRSHILPTTLLARSQINNIFLESQESLEWMVYFFSRLKTKKWFGFNKQHLKQPLFWWVVCPSSTVLKPDGVKNSLRFFDRRKDGMIELRGKSSFSLGLDCRIEKCFLMMLPTSGKFGLNVITNRNNFFVSLHESWVNQNWKVDQKLI